MHHHHFLVKKKKASVKTKYYKIVYRNLLAIHFTLIQIPMNEYLNPEQHTDRLCHKMKLPYLTMPIFN